MTGTAFASLSKYVEVGNILNAKEEPNKQIEELKDYINKFQGWLDNEIEPKI